MFPAWCGQAGLDSTRAKTADTVLFVDVDGVLNVGARDGGNPPLVLDRAGAKGALSLWGKRDQHPEGQSIQRVVSLTRRELGHGESSSYLKLAIDDTLMVSPILLARLASLIRSAGDRQLVVLSSTWQRPIHGERVERLEEALSDCLGVPFTFDARTGSGPNDTSPPGRLQAIGDFLEALIRRQGYVPRRRLRALVLEDFHISAMDGWTCGNMAMDSTAAAEKYLRQRAQNQLAVKVVHTYDEWTTASGLTMQVGSGLTMEYFCQALRFLGTCCDHCTQESARETKHATASMPPRGARKRCAIDANFPEVLTPPMKVPRWSFGRDQRHCRRAAHHPLVSPYLPRPSARDHQRGDKVDAYTQHAALGLGGRNSSGPCNTLKCLTAS